MIYAAGVDVGSTQTKAIIINDKREIVARALTDTGANVTRAADRGFAEALLAAGLKREDVAYVVGTGYGRYKVTFGDAQITEISCHARVTLAPVSVKALATISRFSLMMMALVWVDPTSTPAA